MIMSISKRRYLKHCMKENDFNYYNPQGNCGNCSNCEGCKEIKEYEHPIRNLISNIFDEPEILWFCLLIGLAVVALYFGTSALNVVEDALAKREQDIAAWETTQPTAYLDGQLVDINTLNYSAYNWDYDEENNIVKFSYKPEEKKTTSFIPIIIP